MQFVQFVQSARPSRVEGRCFALRLTSFSSLWIYASREVHMPKPRLLRLASSPMPVRKSSRSHVYLSPTRTNLVEYRKNKALPGDNGSEEHCRFRNAPHCVLSFNLSHKKSRSSTPSYSVCLAAGPTSQTLCTVRLVIRKYRLPNGTDSVTCYAFRFFQV